MRPLRSGLSPTGCCLTYSSHLHLFAIITPNYSLQFGIKKIHPNCLLPIKIHSFQGYLMYQFVDPDLIYRRGKEETPFQVPQAIEPLAVITM